MRRSPAWLLISLLSVLPACMTAPPCGAKNCDGCCTAAGVCEPGNTFSICGGGGNQCDTCVGPQQCLSGVCTAVSGAAKDGGGAADSGLSTDSDAGTAVNQPADGGIVTQPTDGGGGVSQPVDAGPAPVVCTGGCSMFKPEWVQHLMTRPPYGSGATRLRFVDDAHLGAGVGVLATSGGDLYITGGDLFVFDREGRVQGEPAIIGGTIQALAVSPDLQNIAVGTANGQLALVSLDGGVKRLPSHGARDTLAFAPDGTSLYSAVLSNSASGSQVVRYELPGGAFITSMALNAFYVIGLVPSSNGASVDVYDVRYGVDAPSRRTTMRASDLRVDTAATVSTETYVTVTLQPGANSIFFATAHAVMGVPVPGKEIVRAAPHPTLAKAVTLHADGMLRLVDLNKRRVEDEIRADIGAYDVAFSPDGSMVVAAGYSPVLAAFSLISGVREKPSVRPLCGDGVKDPGEACDPAMSMSASCTDVGFTSGSLGCRADCTLDTTACATPRAGWSCTTGAFGDGKCDCGCDVPDPDCGLNPTAAACERHGCANSSKPALNNPWVCAIDSCANVSAVGRCNGPRLEGCAGVKVETLYCESYATGSSGNGTYQKGSCVTRFGAPTCSVPETQTCLVNLNGFGPQFACATAGNACVFSGKPGGSCEPGYAKCGHQQAMCVGTDKAQVGCNAGQPLIYDCFSMGGTCEDAKCVGLWKGAACGESLRCREGLVCTNEVCT